MSPWFWFFVVFALILIILFRIVLNDFRHYRGNARNELVDFIEHRHSDVEILSAGPKEISC